jgi:tRNA dimethylallyltransferase
MNTQQDTSSDDDMDHLSTQELREMLLVQDPLMAAKWHPNDRRKMLRSLQIIRQSGRKHSALMEEQQQQRTQASPLRYRTCILWVHAAMDTLRPRLDARVDIMMQQGMLHEVTRFLDGRTDVDFTRGLAQAIGFKELAPHILSQQSLQECVDRVKTANRQYAKRQLTWIHNKLVPLVDGQAECHMYQLDASDLSTWNETVVQPAMDIVHAFLHHQEMPPSTVRPPQNTLVHGQHFIASETTIASMSVRTCTVCPGSWRGNSEWNSHVKSKVHRRYKSFTG